MPLYRALTEPGLLDVDQRRAFSQDVVDVHCGITGAPPSFVHVLFTEDTEGQLPAGTRASVFGTVRHGRTDDQKHEIWRRLSAAIADRAGIDVTAVTSTTSDINASYTMEGGELLPEPGSPEESEWKALQESPG